MTGGHAIILLDQAGTLPGDAQLKSPEIGTLLEVDTPVSLALALVSALSAPTPATTGEPEVRIVEVELIGELPKDETGRPRLFRRGVSTYPALGDIVGRATQEARHGLCLQLGKRVRIGYIQQDSSIPAMVKIDELLGKHFAVLGTTGTGKSCAVALILRRILESNPNAHILLLDLHREYAPCFGQWAEVVKPDNFNLPFWLLNFEEIVEILIGSQPNRDTDVEILRELIPLAKLRYMGSGRRDRVASLRRNGHDTERRRRFAVPYRSSDLLVLLDERIGELDLKGEPAPSSGSRRAWSPSPRSALQLHVRQPDSAGHHGEVSGRLSACRSTASRSPSSSWAGFRPDHRRQCRAARLAFDFGLWSGGRSSPSCARRRIATCPSTHGRLRAHQAGHLAHRQGGRKYGVSLCVVSQRPASSTPPSCRSPTPSSPAPVERARPGHPQGGKFRCRGIAAGAMPTMAWARPSPSARAWRCPRASSSTCSRRIPCPRAPPPRFRRTRSTTSTTRGFSPGGQPLAHADDEPDGEAGHAEELAPSRPPEPQHAAPVRTRSLAARVSARGAAAASHIRAGLAACRPAATHAAPPAGPGRPAAGIVRSTVDPPCRRRRAQRLGQPSGLAQRQSPAQQVGDQRSSPRSSPDEELRLSPPCGLL